MAPRRATRRAGRKIALLTLGTLMPSTSCLHCAAPAASQRAAILQPALQPLSAVISGRRSSTSPRLSMSTDEERGTLFETFRLPFAAPPPPPPEPEEEANNGGGLAAAGGVLAASAIIAEGVQVAGTAVFFYLGQQWTGTSSPVEAVAYLIDFLQQQGTMGYVYFSTAMVVLQVIPIAAAFVLTVSAGAIFGAVKGTITVLTCSTVSASISFLIARSLGREKLMDVAQENKQFRAIDAAFGDAEFSKSLTLITLLRLSPVLPFAWANYVFGLSPVPLAAFSIGTFVGCLPAVVRAAATRRTRTRSRRTTSAHALTPLSGFEIRARMQSHGAPRLTTRARARPAMCAGRLCVCRTSRRRDRGQRRREQRPRAGPRRGRDAWCDLLCGEYCDGCTQGQRRRPRVSPRAQPAVGTRGAARCDL